MYEDRSNHKSLPPHNTRHAYGLIHPALDAHTLGLSTVGGLLESCGQKVFIADGDLSSACLELEQPKSAIKLREWILKQGIQKIGYSYRLDPDDGVSHFGRFLHVLRKARLFSEQGGPLEGIYFAGLPRACEQVKRAFPFVDGLFSGDESPTETLQRLGIPPWEIPWTLREQSRYDEDRLSFGKDLIARERHQTVRPDTCTNYPGKGTRADTLIRRLEHSRGIQAGPLMRAHVGPYDANREEAVRLFMEWTKQLAAAGHLDILSIGTSQLSQEDFFGEWEGRSDGGGVPIHTEQEFNDVWQAGRPMLLRSYAGSSQVPRMARVLETNLNNAWHTLSLWWFCQLDGRGPNSVLENLREHEQTLRYVASCNKPFEANVPHHFGFRGADDVSCIVAEYLAARIAKRQGIRHFILQAMLNTPKSTWGIQDLAKMRAMLHWTRSLEDDRFQVILQPRGGLDYFSTDENKAKAQLAAVTALMDDIDPAPGRGPEIIHVVSYTEGNRLADPGVVNESIQITRAALTDYRRLKQRGAVEDPAKREQVMERTAEMIREAGEMIRAIDELIPDATCAEGLHQVLELGFFPLPYLWRCREQYPRALEWKTQSIQGAVKVVNQQGVVVSTEARMKTLRLLGKGGCP